MRVGTSSFTQRPKKKGSFSLSDIVGKWEKGDKFPIVGIVSLAATDGNTRP